MVRNRSMLMRLSLDGNLDLPPLTIFECIQCPCLEHDVHLAVPVVVRKTNPQFAPEVPPMLPTYNPTLNITTLITTTFMHASTATHENHTPAPLEKLAWYLEDTPAVKPWNPHLVQHHHLGERSATLERAALVVPGL